MSAEGLYPKTIAFSTVYQSTTQGPDHPVRAIIRSEDELEKLLPGTPVGKIDFTGKQLIAVALGHRPNNGYDVQITSVVYVTDRLQGRPPLMIVGYTDTERGGSQDMLTKPIHVVSTERLEGEADFEPHIQAGRCGDWKAWIDAEPPGRNLHVKGRCVYPCPGWTVTLEKSTPQGSSSNVLVLERKSEGEYRPGATTVYEPTYQQKLAGDENYDKVTIKPENVTINVDVVH